VDHASDVRNRALNLENRIEITDPIEKELVTETNSLPMREVRGDVTRYEPA
jgi:hypothetical protein